MKKISKKLKAKKRAARKQKLVTLCDYSYAMRGVCGDHAWVKNWEGGVDSIPKFKVVGKCNRSYVDILLERKIKVDRIVKSVKTGNVYYVQSRFIKHLDDMEHIRHMSWLRNNPIEDLCLDY